MQSKKKLVIRALIGDLVDLAVDITQNGSDCFFQYHAHVNSAEIHIYKERWEEENEPFYRKTVYLDQDEAIEDLIMIKSFLEKTVKPMTKVKKCTS